MASAAYVGDEDHGSVRPPRPRPSATCLNTARSRCLVPLCRACAPTTFVRIIICLRVKLPSRPVKPGHEALFSLTRTLIAHPRPSSTTFAAPSFICRCAMGEVQPLSRIICWPVRRWPFLARHRNFPWGRSFGRGQPRRWRATSAPQYAAK